MSYPEKYDCNDFDLLARLKEVKPKCKENTLKEYMKKFHRFKNRFNDPKFGSRRFSFLNATRYVEDELMKYTEGTRKNYLSMLIAIAKCCEMEQNESLFIEWFNELRAKTAKPKTMTQKTIDKWITFKQIKDTRKYYVEKFDSLIKSRSRHKRLLKRDEVDLINYVVLMLYFSDCEKLAKAQNPPRRLEYANTVVRYATTDEDKVKELEEQDKNRNVLWVNEKGMPNWFWFNNYKTKKHYGTYKVGINKKLKRVLNFYLKIKNILPDDLKELNNSNHWLLPKKDGHPISSNQLGQILKRTFYGNTQKYPTINTLRAIFTSEVFKNTPKTGLLKSMCKGMGNSLRIQMEYYRKGLNSNGTLKCEDILSDD